MTGSATGELPFRESVRLAVRQAEVFGRADNPPASLALANLHKI